MGMCRVVTVTGTVLLLALGGVRADARPQATASPTQAPAQAAPQAPAPATPAQQPPPTTRPGAPVNAPTGVAPPSDYVIGPDDVLAIVFWREKDLSSDNVVVRPDGKITLPIINDIQAAGLTPEQLREKVSEAASRYVEDANATVIVKTINSRRVFVTGQVGKPGMAGGMGDFAKKNKIVVMRTENGVTKSFKFNYKEVLNGQNLQQNILLKPGDTIIVP
jgi:polysaccharide biosynthesis/export protein